MIGAFIGGAALGVGESWVTFLTGTGAIVLTFLAGAELDPRVLRVKWKEASAIGLVSFAVPLACGVAAVVLPWLTPRFFKRVGGRPSELEAKFLMFLMFLMFLLFGLGALAAWADSEAVLPAYLTGMVLAGTVGKDHALVRRLRTLTFGLLTPFYFIRAGSLVSVHALVAAPGAFLVLLLAKTATKVVGVYPCTARRARRLPTRRS